MQNLAVRGSQGIEVAVCVAVEGAVAVRVGGIEVDVGSREGRIVDVALLAGTTTVWVEAQETRNIKQKKLGINLIKTPKG